MSTHLLPDLAGLLPSWQRAVRAERKSPATAKSYTEGIATFLTFVAELLESGKQPKTVAACRWLRGWIDGRGRVVDAIDN